MEGQIMRNAVLVKNDTVVRTRKNRSIFGGIWPVARQEERRVKKC